MAIASLDEIKTYLGLKVGLSDTTTDAQAAVLALVHPLAEAAIKTHLDSNVEQATYTELLPADDLFDNRPDLATYERISNRAVRVPHSRGNILVQLKHTPVVPDGLQVWEDPGAYAGQMDNAFSDAVELVAGRDFYLDMSEPGLSLTGQVVRIGTWSSERRTIKVTYKGGWSAEHLADGGPAAGIRLAAILTTVKGFKQQMAHADLSKLGPVVSESIGEYSVSYASTALERISGMMVSVPPEAAQLLQKFRNYRLF